MDIQAHIKENNQDAKESFCLIQQLLHSRAVDMENLSRVIPMMKLS